MASRISKEQLAKAKHMRQSGHSWHEIAEKVNASERSLCYHAKREGWTIKTLQTSCKPAAKSLQSKDLNLDELAEILRGKLANDASQSIEALQSWPAGNLELHEFEKRERIAESIQKRATSLLNIGEKQEPVVNIALMSQLPDKPSLTAAKVYDVESHVE